MVRHLLKSSNNILHLCNIGERREEEKREEEKERKKRNIEDPLLLSGVSKVNPFNGTEFR